MGRPILKTLKEGTLYGEIKSIKSFHMQVAPQQSSKKHCAGAVLYVRGGGSIAITEPIIGARYIPLPRMGGLAR